MSTSATIHFLLGALFLSTAASAGGIEQVVMPSENHVFITLSSGNSWSQDADISVDTAFWDQSPQGYNADLGTSLILGAEAGYIINSLFSAGVGLSYRGDYDYRKFQTSEAAATPGFVGDKTRLFDLTDTAVNEVFAEINLSF